ncbi:hypothetical protein MBLNU13_g01906t1 [Cladosporium sp. NU13]
MHTHPGPTPRRPDGQPAWFTPEHNAFVERLLHFPPGAVLDMYQKWLVPAAQRILGENRDVPPPAYEEAVLGAFGGITNASVNSETPRRAVHARPGHGPGNLEGLSRRGAVRIPERRRVRQRAEEHEEESGNAGERRSSARAGVPARRPVPAPAPVGERVQRGRVGDARNEGSVSSRTRSRSVRREGMASKFLEAL